MNHAAVVRKPTAVMSHVAVIRKPAAVMSNAVILTKQIAVMNNAAFKKKPTAVMSDVVSGCFWVQRLPLRRLTAHTFLFFLSDLACVGSQQQ